MPTKKEQQEQRRLQILTVALDLFVARGFYGTSTREISKTAGISSGLMFHYFASKEHLYEELIAIGCEKMEVNVEEGTANPLGFLSAVAEELFYMLEQSPFAAKMFVFMGNALFHKDISDKANEMLEQHHIIEQSTKLIAKGQELRQFKQGDPLALSTAFWSAIQGIAQEAALRPEIPLPKSTWVIDIIKEHHPGGTNEN